MSEHPRVGTCARACGWERALVKETVHHCNNTAPASRSLFGADGGQRDPKHLEWRKRILDCRARHSTVSPGREGPEGRARGEGRTVELEVVGADLGQLDDVVVRLAAHDPCAKAAAQRCENGACVDSKWIAPGCCSHMSTKFLRDVTGLSNIASFVVIVLAPIRTASSANEDSRGAVRE